MKIIVSEIDTTLKDIIQICNLDIDDPSFCFIFPEIPAVEQAENLFLADGVWGDRFLTFGKLSSIVNENNEHRSFEASRLWRLFLVEDILDEVEQDLSYFKEIKDKQSFSEAAIRLITELKHSNIKLNQISELRRMVSGGELINKLADIELIYDRYQKVLEKYNHADDIDRLRMLSASADKDYFKNIFYGINKFILFGFYDFTRTQLTVLKSIDDSGFEVEIHVSGLNKNSDFYRNVFDKFEAAFGKYRIEKLVKKKKTNRVINICSYQNLKEECEYTAKEIKRTLLGGSVKGSNIAVIFRNILGKEDYIINAFEKYGLPYSINGGVSLLKSSLAQFVTDIIKVRFNGYKRSSVVNILKSPFISACFKGFNDVGGLVSEIDIGSRNSRVSGGLDIWVQYLDGYSNRRFAKRLKHILLSLDKRFRSVKLSSLYNDIISLLDELQVLESVKSLSVKDPNLSNIWNSLVNGINEIGFLSNKISNKRLKSPDEIIYILREIFREIKVPCSTQCNDEKVKILEGLNLRGSCFSYVFLLDLTEKSFPFFKRADPILKYEDRYELNGLLGNDLFELDSLNYESEEHLFDLIVNSVKKKIQVSYSKFDDKGNTVLPSYLLTDLKEKNEVNEYRNRFENRFDTENIYTMNELSETIFYKGYKDIKECNEFLYRYWKPYSWIVNGIVSEKSRLSTYGCYSTYDGVFEIPEFIEGFTSFTPTGLEDYGSCPFKYFSSKILGLGSLRDVGDEIEVLDLGQLYHNFLKNFFCLLAEKTGGRIDLKGIRNEEIENIYNDFLAEEDYDHYLSGLSRTVKEFLEKKVFKEVLPRFINEEANRIREGNLKGFYPAKFENKIIINLGEYGIKGKADRIDTNDNNVLVIDYKSGSLGGKRFSDYKNLQLPLYLYGLREQGNNPVGGSYRSISNPEEEIISKSNTIDEEIQRAIGFVNSYIDLINTGFFAPVAEKKEVGFENQDVEIKLDNNGPCRWCDFKDLCRVSGGVFRKLRSKNMNAG